MHNEGVMTIPLIDFAKLKTGKTQTFYINAEFLS